MNFSTEPLSYPPPASPLLAAVQWIEGLLLGSVATAVAVIAIAAFGMLMLSGRVSIRRGAEVVLGCFLLFGSASIAAGLRSMADSGVAPVAIAPAPLPPPAPMVLPPPAPKAYNPFASASVPTPESR